MSVLPPALELLRRVEAEVGRIWKVRDEAEVLARVQALNAEIARANARAAEGPPTRLGALDEEELAGWYSRAAVYALPARYEPFGLTALEAKTPIANAPRIPPTPWTPTTSRESS